MFRFCRHTPNKRKDEVFYVSKLTNEYRLDGMSANCDKCGLSMDWHLRHRAVEYLNGKSFFLPDL